ncbi:MAG: M20 family metallopeptidase [Anaerolineae bacterium]|nr:M20 family metallopeptidase [Anaerolineae bacterium]
MGPSLPELKERVMSAVDAMRDDLIRISTTIHEHPEVAFEEYQAMQLLSDTAERHGFVVERGIADLPTAFRAQRSGASPGVTVAFLAEYDALPGLGHACGHNIIGTAALGAALAVGTVIDELPGTVVLLGTPAEEKGGGKALLVDRGAFQDIDVAMMIHPSVRNMTRRRSLSSHNLFFEFFGKAAHAAAAPDEGINALHGVILLFNNVNALRGHVPDGVRIHGIIPDGGDAHNIVPEYATARFSVRAPTSTLAQEIVDKVIVCAQAAAMATGAQVKIQDLYHYDNMIPNPILADLFDRNLHLLGREVQEPDANERMGSTDMGNVSHVVPALHAYIAIADEGVAGHTPEFREAAVSPRGHEGLIAGAKALAMTAIDLLTDPGTFRQVQETFRQSIAENA